MSQYPCKILTDKGALYAIYCDTIDQFTTPAVHSTDARVGFEDAGGRHVFDLRTAVLDRVETLLAKLESGKSLTIAEACAVNKFEGFLKGTVADHQYAYEETSDQVLEGWVTELGLRKRFPDYEPRDIVTDRGIYPAFQDKAHRARFKHHELGQRPTASQNKIAARYLRALAAIANVFGPGRTMPDEIVNKFVKIARTRVPGT